jgi:hypothetical protein
MEEERKGKMTLGRAIDVVLSALEPLDASTRDVALRAVCDKLGIIREMPPEPAPSRARTAQPEVTRAELALPPKITPPTDIRTLAQQKAPQSTSERVALVAYYLADHAPAAERKDSIDTEDVQKYFRQAGFGLPRRPRQALSDGFRAGYLERVRLGQYRLSPAGYNLVAHNLPRSQAERPSGVSHISPSVKPASARKNR